MKKRLIVLALIAALLLTQLMACSKTEDDEASTEETTAEESTTEETTPDDKTPDSDKTPDNKEPDDDDKTPDETPEEHTNLLMYSFSNGDLDGCVAEACTTTVEDGIIHLVCDTASGTNRWDPKITICPEDMPLTGSDFTTCEIKLKYDVTGRTTPSTSTLFFWYGEGSSDFYYIEHHYDTDSSGDEWITIKFDLSEMLLWKNFPIYKVRWDPFECVGTCDIDYIAFYNGNYTVTEDDIPVDETKPNIDTVSDDIVVGKDSEYTLSVTASGGTAPYTYSWSDGTSVVGTEASITLSNSVAGTYNYTCTVTDANNQSVVSESVEVLVAGHYLAYNFNTDGDNEGWVPNGVLGTATVSNGAYHLVSDTPSGTRYDPTLTLSGLSLNGSDYTKCIVTYKYDFGNATKDYQATLFAWGNSDAILSKDVMPASTVSEEFVTITFDLSAWSEHTITKLRFDACECAGTAYIDSIIFVGV